MAAISASHVGEDSGDGPAVTAVKIFQQLPQLFRYADVEKFTGNTYVFLTRALQNGLVERIARVWVIP